MAKISKKRWIEAMSIIQSLLVSPSFSNDGSFIIVKWDENQLFIPIVSTEQVETIDIEI